MPGPVVRPTDTVTPEVSECRRIPDSRRPVSTATIACPPSWAIVTTVRATRHSPRWPTTSSASSGASSGTSWSGGTASRRGLRSRSACPHPASPRPRSGQGGHQLVAVLADPDAQALTVLGDVAVLLLAELPGRAEGPFAQRDAAATEVVGPVLRGEERGTALGGEKG